MAINFEAANMVGYNNPKIEVFKAILNYETNAITEAPSKTEIIRCLNRGSIPAIMCNSPRRVRREPALGLYMGNRQRGRHHNVWQYCFNSGVQPR